LNPEALFESLRTGLTPFLGLPMANSPAPVPGVVLGAPYDGGVINRPGARFGPWAIRNATMGMGRMAMPMRLQGQDEGGRGMAAGDWVDGGNIPTRPFSMEEALGAVQQTMALLTLGALRAHAAKAGPLGLLHLDAHPDAGHGELWGTKYHHGTWLRQAIEEGLVDPRHTVQIGLRAPRFESEELVFLLDAGVRMWTPWDLQDQRLHAQLQGDIARVGQRPAYVSVDLDVLDPAHCPAVAEPVPGGLTVMEVLTLLRHIHRWGAPWVGADIMELAPALEGSQASAKAAAHIALHLF